MGSVDLIIIGGGDSLRGFDFDRLPKGVPIWAVNWAACFLPRYDKLIALDGFQEGYPTTDIETERTLHGGRWDRQGPGINRKPGHVGRINHSIFFAVNIALHEGFRNIVILGADQRGHRHWYDPEYVNINWNFRQFDIYFRAIAEGLEIGESVTLVESSCEHLPNLTFKQFWAKVEID